MSIKNILLGGSAILAILLIGSFAVIATYMKYAKPSDDSVTGLVAMNGKIENIGQDTKEDDNEDIDEDDLSQEELSNLQAEITQEQAVKIALNKVDGEVTDVEIERKRGREVYAVEIDDDGDEVDVFVDIKTGEIVGTERDSEEDEEDDD